ncbi:MAG: hypothetical protein M0D55_03145 [Elusimicrobiota bacterium]|nr:MAG: hypothetical protein M0D55_03145 [Elusimicrobiota bacterium]
MATKAEGYRYVEERSHAKKAKRGRKPAREARPGRSEAPRILESSRTRGQDIRVNHPYRPPV